MNAAQHAQSIRKFTYKKRQVKLTWRFLYTVRTIISVQLLL